MVFLAIFDKNVEDAFGRLQYLAFYIAGGFVAMMAASVKKIATTASVALCPYVAALALAWLYAVRLFQDYVVNPHVAVQTVGLSPLVTLVSVAVVGVLFGGLAVILAVPVTSTVATLIDVLVLGHQPPSERALRWKARRPQGAP